MQPAERAAYHRDGFVVLPVFTAEEVRELRDLVHRLVREPGVGHPRLRFHAALETPSPTLDPANPYAVYRVLNTPLAGDRWFELIREPRVLRVLTELIGPDVNFHMGFLRLRPTGLRVSEGWHRDFTTDRHTRPELVTALTYLDDMDEESGATLVWPGSHLRPEVPGEQPPAGQAVPVTVPAGSVLFLHCLTVHRTSVNRTARNRSILLHEYKSAAAVELEPNDSAFADLPLTRGGRPWPAG